MTDSNMSDATRQGTSTTGSLSEAGRETYQQVKSKAYDAMSRTTEAAKTQAMDQAETAKDALADTGERLAQSLRSALDGGDDSVQARLMGAAADTVSDLANSLRGRSFNQLLSDAESFARRNPGAFVAAAALAGFALARFARASASSSSHDSQYGGQSYGAAGGTTYGSGGMGDSSMGAGSGSGMGSGGGYAGAGAFGAGTGAGYGAGRGMGGHVSTSGMSTHDDDLDEAGSIADDGLGGGTGAGTPNSTSTAAARAMTGKRS
jgi:ElaB/YqjD/DUF883 family membrane-anchored ribosome-binding protein